MFVFVFLSRVALVAQRPIVVKLSRGRFVGLSVCPVHIVEKRRNRIRMPFGIISRTGPGMRQIVGFGDRSTGRVLLGRIWGAPLYPIGTLRRICATAPRRGPLSKLLWANLLCVIIAYYTIYSVYNTDASDVCAIDITYLLTYTQSRITQLHSRVVKYLFIYSTGLAKLPITHYATGESILVA